LALREWLCSTNTPWFCGQPVALGIIHLYTYDNRFFNSVDFAAAISADHVLGLLAKQMPIKSVLDLGCWSGRVAGELGAPWAEDVQGIDGP